MQPLAATVPRLDSDGVALLEQMLVYDPNKRISAVDAMRHPYFKSLPKAIHDLDDSMRLAMSLVLLSDMAFGVGRIDEIWTFDECGAADGIPFPHAHQTRQSLCCRNVRSGPRYQC